MIYTATQIQNLPSGRVLKRASLKEKLIVVVPVKIWDCDICGQAINGNACKWVRSGNVCISKQCPDCTAKELNSNG